MSFFNRKWLVQGSVAALVAIAAACGGGDQAEAPAGDAAVGTAPAEAPAAAPAAAPAGGGKVVEVKMVTTNGGASGVFEPAQVTVSKGDIIRFINDGAAPHNANFQTAPENGGKSNLPEATPYLTSAGQTADVQVTMDPGTYAYQCDPHAAMGMKGQVTVQ